PIYSRPFTPHCTSATRSSRFQILSHFLSRYSAMGSLISAMWIAAQALDVDQSALNVTTNNIANASTPGYSREVVNLTEQTPIESGNLTIGTGVNLQNIQSVRDQMLSVLIAEQNTQQSGSQTQLNALQQVQGLFSDPTQGIGANLTAFFNSISQL